MENQKGVNVVALGFSILVAVAGGLLAFAGTKRAMSNDGDQSHNRDHNSIPVGDTNNGVIRIGNEGDATTPAVGKTYNQGDSRINSTGEKIINGIVVGQAVLNRTVGLIQSVATVVSNVDRLVNPKNYKTTMLSDPLMNSGYYGPRVVPPYMNGDYPWNRPDNCGLPYGEPVEKGQGINGDNIYWVRKSDRVIEVW